MIWGFMAFLLGGQDGSKIHPKSKKSIKSQTCSSPNIRLHKHHNQHQTQIYEIAKIKTKINPQIKEIQKTTTKINPES